MAIKAKEQVTLIDITDAYSVVLTSESYTFAGNTSGAPANSSCSTQVVAYQGSALVQKVNVSSVSCPTGISYTVSGNGGNSPTITFKTTATVTTSCEATITVKVDDVTFNKKFSFAVAKTGATGTKGDTGSAGKSIGSITNYYLATNSSSDVTASTSGWTTTVQSVSASKKYLWNYEVIKYTDGAVASTSAPCIIGAYGDKGNTGSTGATGNGISKITEHYAVSSSTNVPTTWYDTLQTMTATNKYLWNYETIYYTNGTTADTTKRVIGVYGDKGNTGATGTSISETIRYYKLQDSSAAAPSKPTSNPPSGWTTTEPTYASGKSLYFVDCTVYSTGRVAFSDVSKSSSYTAANDLKDQVDEIKMNVRISETGVNISKTDSNTEVQITNEAMNILVNNNATTSVDATGLNAYKANLNSINIGPYTIELIDGKRLRFS